MNFRLVLDSTSNGTAQEKRWKNSDENWIWQSRKCCPRIENKSNFNEIKFLQLNVNWKFLAGTLIKFLPFRLSPTGKFMFFANGEKQSREKFSTGGSLLITRPGALTILFADETKLKIYAIARPRLWAAIREIGNWKATRTWSRSYFIVWLSIFQIMSFFFFSGFV